MIVIFEPQCKVFSHEKVNSGFIYGLYLAFPGEILRFYGHRSHIEALQNVLKLDHENVPPVEWVSVDFEGTSTFSGTIHYYFLFKKIFLDLISFNVNQIFFLSFNPVLLYLIKKFKQKLLFNKLRFTFVLHGSFESIVEPISNPIQNTLAIITKNRTLKKDKIKSLKISTLFKKVLLKTKHIFEKISLWPVITNKFFTEKRVLLWKNSKDYRYIVLSPHILSNIAKIADLKQVCFYPVVLPTAFSKIGSGPKNDYIKFAIFGYGDSLMLQSIALELEKRKITKKYEIRIIGMDNRGTENFPHVTCPSPGKPLTRTEMEQQVQDIDVFLILYGKNRYRLSCSGSILEALSYQKPILHFDNDCIDFFNKDELPIGIRSHSLDQYVDLMVAMIEDYVGFQPKLYEYRKNIQTLRERYSIENSVPGIKESFTW